MAVAEPRRVALDLGPGEVTLREFVSAVVRSEVAAFRERAADRSVLRSLTDGALAEGTLVGKITSGRVQIGTDIDADVENAVGIDERAAVDAALLAYTDGLYEVVVDDEPVVSLDHVVQVSTGMSVMFIRLVALSGG